MVYLRYSDQPNFILATKFPHNLPYPYRLTDGQKYQSELNWGGGVCFTLIPQLLSPMKSCVFCENCSSALFKEVRSEPFEIQENKESGEKWR